MALTGSQKETIIRALRGKIKGNCPMCGQSAWTLGDELVAAVAASLAGGLGIGGPYIPMAQLVCNNCGFVGHHGVGALGIKLE